MPETKKAPEIKSDKEAIELYSKILENSGLNPPEAKAMANEIFSPLVDESEPKTAK